MFATLEDFLSTQQRDSNEFMERVRELVIGLARDYEPVRLYVIRIDNWFEPRWMKFAGKFTTGKHFAIGVHKRRLHVPPFVPPRLVVQGVFVGPGYEETVSRPPLHIDCPSSKALVRRIEDIDKDAAFIWFGGDSEAQGRGAVMVYLPVALETTKRRRDLRDCGAFYVGYSLGETNWEPSMLRGVSRGEVAHLLESGRAFR